MVIFYYSLSLSSRFSWIPHLRMYLSCLSGAASLSSCVNWKAFFPSSPPFLIKAFQTCLMFTVLCKVSKQTALAEYKHWKETLSPPSYPFIVLKSVSPCHSYSSKRKLLLFEKKALKSRDMKGKSSLREEGQRVRGRLKDPSSYLTEKSGTSLPKSESRDTKTSQSLTWGWGWVGRKRESKKIFDSF